MYTIEIAKETACLMLKDVDGNLVDYHFINKFHFENFMTNEELRQEIEAFASKNNGTVKYI